MKLLSHASAKKKTKSVTGFNFALLLVVFMGHHGIEGVNTYARQLFFWCLTTWVCMCDAGGQRFADHPPWPNVFLLRRLLHHHRHHRPDAPQCRHPDSSPLHRLRCRGQWRLVLVCLHILHGGVSKYIARRGVQMYCTEGCVNILLRWGVGLNIVHRGVSKYISRRVGLNVLHGGCLNIFHEGWV